MVGFMPAPRAHSGAIQPGKGAREAGVARFPRGLARGDTGWHAFQLGANSPPRGHPPGLRPSLGPLELAASRNGPGAGREGGYFPWSHTYRGPTGLQPPVPHTPCMPPVPSASPPRATAGSLGTLAPLRPGIRGFQRGWLPWGGYRGRGQGVPGAGGPLFRANTGRNRGGSRLPRARPPSPRTGTRGNSPVLPPRGGQPAPGPSPASPRDPPDPRGLHTVLAQEGSQGRGVGWGPGAPGGSPAGISVPLAQGCPDPGGGRRPGLAGTPRGPLLPRVPP